MSRRCPQCSGPMLTFNRQSDDARRVSRDHILPKARGGRDMIFGDTRNLRPMCQACNQLIASCGHCVGAAACVRDMARLLGISAVAKKWAMSALWAREETRICSERKARAKAAVAIGQKLQQCDIGEFVIPAETASARVWNLATLDRRAGIAQRVAGGASA